MQVKEMNGQEAPGSDRHSDARVRDTGKFHIVTFPVVVSVISCIGYVFLRARRSNLVLLFIPLFIIGVVGAIFAFISIFKRWRKHRWLSLIPLAVCLVSLFLAPRLVEPARSALFVLSLPSYEAVVHRVESGSISLDNGYQTLPEAKSEVWLTYSVGAEKCADGVVMIEFMTEEVPLTMAAGYVYTSSGSIEPGSDMDSIWPVRRQVRPGWFYVER
jgi:hypothetical protein